MPLLRVLLVAVLLLPGSVLAAETDEADDDLLLFSNYEFEYEPDDDMFARTWRRTANESISFANETVSDLWNITKSPIDWRMREWLTFASVAGGATALIYLGDEKIRKKAVASEGFRDFGGKIDFLSDGTAFVALTGGFLLSGSLFRDKEIETAKLLMESSAIGYGFSTGLKYLTGRRRPGPTGAQDFDPFSGEFSMPSGETTNAFAMASVIAEQYPNWPVRIASYGLAACVAAGRIARDDHWTSDVFVAAALGTFVGRSVSWLHRERTRRNEERSRLGLAPKRDALKHSFQLSTRSARWSVQF